MRRACLRSVLLGLHVSKLQAISNIARGRCHLIPPHPGTATFLSFCIVFRVFVRVYYDDFNGYLPHSKTTNRKYYSGSRVASLNRELEPVVDRLVVAVECA